MIDGRDPHWISTVRSSDFGYIRWDRLEREGLIGASGGADGERFRSPECVDFFVECDVDLGGCSTIIVTLKHVSGWR